MIILVALAILLIAGILLKMSIIFAPISLAVTMLVVKFIKKHYCPLYCNHMTKETHSGNKGTFTE